MAEENREWGYRIIEQDHRAIKRRVNAKQGFREFQAAQRTIQGYEAMNIIRKGQVIAERRFIDDLFEVAA
jgi:IS6 family transposase